MNPIARLILVLIALSPTSVTAQVMSSYLAFVPGRYAPMTNHERWQSWWSNDGGSPAIYLEAISVGAFDQADGHPREWGGGAAGFSRRAGSEFGSIAIQNSLTGAMAAGLRTDTRYFACGCGGFFHRAGHALEMSLLTYNRNGHKTLDIAQLAGSYGGPMIATLWWPPHYSALVQGVQGGHIQVGVAGAVHLVQEFSPEIRRLLRLRSSRAATGGEAGAP